MTEALFKEIRDLLVEIKDLLKARSLPDKNTQTIINQESSEQRNESWEQHLEEKRPNNDYEIIALVVEKLTRAKGSVTKEEIVDFLRDNPDRLNNTNPKALSSAINNAKNKKTYQYIEYANKKGKTYHLSIKGRQLVKRLPDREENTKQSKRNKR